MQFEEKLLKKNDQLRVPWHRRRCRATTVSRHSPVHSCMNFFRGGPIERRVQLLLPRSPLEANRGLILGLKLRVVLGKSGTPREERHECK
jgi:hypothetical protein